MGCSGGNGGKGKGPQVRATAGTDDGDGSGLLGAAALGVRVMDGLGKARTRARLLVRRQGTTKGLKVGDLGSGTGRLTAREARGGGGGGGMNEDEWSPSSFL